MNLGVKCQGQIYENQSVWLAMRMTFAFLMQDVHIWHNDFLWCVDATRLAPTDSHHSS